MPTQAVPTVTPLPTPPNPADPATFSNLAYPFVVAQRDTFGPQMLALANNVKFNADDAITSATAAAASATAASNSATTASNQVPLATAQVTLATTQATNAATSAASAVNAPGTSGTSTTSLTITAATQTFTTQTAKAWAVGQSVSIARTSAPAASVMYGTITDYNSATGSMSVLIPTGSFVGTGTFTDWTIALSGPPLPLKTINGTTLAGAGNIAIASIVQPLSRRAFITASTTHTIPAGVTSARGYAVGRGGDSVASASSGGGGGMAYGDIAVVAGDVLTVNIVSGVATVIKGGVTMLTANPASGITAGTASINAAVTNGGAFSGGVGTNAVYPCGGASSGSPLGAGVASLAVIGSGGSGWGGAGNSGGISLGSGGGVGAAGGGRFGGRGLVVPSTDPLLVGLDGLGGSNTTSDNGGPGQAGAGGGAGPGGSGVGGGGGFGGGGGVGNAGGAGGFGGGGGASTGAAGGAGGFGGGAGCGSANATGGAAAVLIYY